MVEPVTPGLIELLPDELRDVSDLQTAIPRLAKTGMLTDQIEAALH